MYRPHLPTLPRLIGLPLQGGRMSYGCRDTMNGPVAVMFGERDTGSRRNQVRFGCPDSGREQIVVGDG